MKPIIIFVCFLVLLNFNVFGQGKYAQIDGLNMYYEIHGQGEPLLILHGGTKSVEAIRSLIDYYSKHYMVIAPEQQAHGRTGDTDGPLSYQLMAEHTVSLLKYLNIDSANIIGHSDGGIIALTIAVNNPKVLRRIVMIGTNYTYRGVVDGEFVEFIESANAESWPNEEYAELSPDGPEHWGEVIKKLGKMWMTSPDFTISDLAKISTPSLILVGDKEMIPLSHTTNFYQAMPNAQLAVIPNAGHEVLFEEANIVNGIILNFLKQK